MLKKILCGLALVAGLAVAGEAREYKQFVGSGTVTNAAADQTLVAAPGADQTLYITDVYLFVSTAAAGGGGLISLENGTNGAKIVTMDADALGSQYIHFGSPGFPLTSNTLLNLTVDGAGTTQAAGGATVRGNVVK